MMTEELSSFYDYQRVVVLAIGSRGDVVPMISLARKIASIGIATEVVGLSDYASLVDGSRIRFHSIGRSIAEMRKLASGLRGRAVVGSSLAQLRLLNRWLDSISDDLVRTLVHVVWQDDLLLTGVLTHRCASELQRYLGCKAVTILLTGLAPSSSFESCLYAAPEKAPAYLRRARADLSWQLVTGVSRAASRKIEKYFRSGARMPLDLKRSSARHPIIVAASPTLVPTASDWAPHTVQTGYPLDDGPGRVSDDPDIVSMLDEGGPCVYVGLGSVAEASDLLTRKLVDSVVQMAERTQTRVIMPAGTASSAGRVSEYVLCVGEVDHRWLFPQVDGIIHHGGAGTTTTGLLSGTPSMVMAFAFDQAYHGRRLAKLGVGPDPLRGDKFDVLSLEERVLALTRGPASNRFKIRAREVAQVIRREDGAARTMHLLLGGDFSD